MYVWVTTENKLRFSEGPIRVTHGIVQIRGKCNFGGMFLLLYQEQFEDTKGVIRIRISKKNRRHNDQMEKSAKDKQRSTNIHIKLKIEQHEPH